MTDTSGNPPLLFWVEYQASGAVWSGPKVPRLYLVKAGRMGAAEFAAFKNSVAAVNATQNKVIARRRDGMTREYFVAATGAPTDSSWQAFFDDAVTGKMTENPLRAERIDELDVARITATGTVNFIKLRLMDLPAESTSEFKDGKTMPKKDSYTSSNGQVNRVWTITPSEDGYLEYAELLGTGHYVAGLKPSYYDENVAVFVVRRDHPGDDIELMETGSDGERSGVIQNIEPDVVKEFTQGYKVLTENEARANKDSKIIMTRGKSGRVYTIRGYGDSDSQEFKDLYGYGGNTDNVAYVTKDGKSLVLVDDRYGGDIVTYTSPEGIDMKTDLASFIGDRRLVTPEDDPTKYQEAVTNVLYPAQTKFQNSPGKVAAFFTTPFIDFWARRRSPQDPIYYIFSSSTPEEVAKFTAGYKVLE